MAAIEAALVFGSIIILLFLLVNHRARRVREMHKFQSPPPYRMLFGNTLEFKDEPSEFLEQIMGWCSQFKGIFCLWLSFAKPFLLIYEPKTVEVILSSSKHITKAQFYDFLLPWLGTGLLTSTGEKWKKRRRLITPTFHFKILNDFVQVFDQQSQLMVSIIKSQPSDKVFNIFPLIACCALDIIGKTAMGVNINAQKNSSSEYVKGVIRMSELIQSRQKRPWVHPAFLYCLTNEGREHNKIIKFLHDFTNQVITERIQERLYSPKEQDETEESDEFTGRRKRRLVAFLDMLLNAYDAGEIDVEGVREEVDIFMFEGHDTTAAAMAWAVQLLGEHPDVQRKAQAEVDEFFATNSGKLTADSLKGLKYLECVIKETLRIFPSVPFFGRSLVEDLELEGRLIPKGTDVGVITIGLHRNPEVWPSPMKFNPDRFLPENSEGRHPYAFVPFSAGSRNCIGQRFALLEEKVVLAYILHNFDIVSTEKSTKIKTCAELITRPRDGIFVSLTTREQGL
ncbi:predicted protein [Nematostella vectensis]|uniref:Cytochrome P450 n=1 Tax=Nematostella vectensis TaxID=45351 RepID=A7SWY9_NEMVE|nr:predicted protein [Nematostella vectensis]|eukprot:XP_001623876.1 predicted protein [Nematostella vectensis]